MQKNYNNLIKNIIKSRTLQLEINKGLLNNQLLVPVHLAFGHEYIAALVFENFRRKNDKLVLTHRNIHYSSLFSKNFKSKYSKFFKNNNNLKKIKGSMNFTDPKSGIIYTSSILGNNLSVATGISKCLKNKESLCFCVTGDGAIEEGSFYETLILSKFLRLPIIYLIENNDWSMATSIKERRSTIDLKLLTKSLGIKYKYFKIKNLKNNYKNFKDIVKKARIDHSPIVFEFEIKTLGSDQNMKTKAKYHHGPSKSKIIDKLFFEPKDKDILFQAFKQLK